MTFYLHKNVLKLWQFSAAVVFTAVFLCLLFLNLGRLAVFIAVVLSILFCFVIFLYLPRLFKATVIEVKNGKIYCSKGLVFKREFIFPNSRTVYLQVLRLPIICNFGLYAVVVKCVGKAVCLPLLTYSQLTDFKTAVQTNG